MVWIYVYYKKPPTARIKNLHKVELLHVHTTTTYYYLAPITSVVIRVTILGGVVTLFSSRAWSFL